MVTFKYIFGSVIGSLMADMTLEEYNVGREAMQLPPVTELPENLRPKTEAKTTPQATHPASPAAEVKIEPTTIPATPAPRAELTEEEVLEFLKKKGKNVSSFDDIRTAEVAQKSKEEIEAERDANRLTFGLQKGFFKKAEYDSFTADASDKESLVMQDYFARARAADPDATEEEIQTEFESKYGLDADETSRRYKTGQQELADRASLLLKKKHGKIYEADNQFVQHEKISAAEMAQAKTFAEQAPVYKQELKEVFKSLKNLKGKLTDGSDYEIEVSDEDIDAAAAEMLNDGFISAQLKAGVPAKALAAAAEVAIKQKNFGKILSTYAAKEQLKYTKGTAGIPVIPTTVIVNDDKYAHLTPNERIMLEEGKKMQANMQN